MALNAAERETVFTISDEDGSWLVSSFRRKDITRLKKNPDLIVLEEGVFEGTPFLSGKIAEGAISIRAKSAGSITRKKGESKVGRTINAAKCSENKADGTPCKSIAMKSTGKCYKHSQA